LSQEEGENKLINGIFPVIYLTKPEFLEITGAFPANLKRKIKKGCPKSFNGRRTAYS
jgi:hypothetical protein